MWDYMMFWFAKPMSEFIGSLALALVVFVCFILFALSQALIVVPFKSRRGGYRYKAMKEKLIAYIGSQPQFVSSRAKTVVAFNGDASREFSAAWAFENQLYDKVFSDGIREGWLQDTGLEPEMNYLHHGKIIQSHLRLVK